MGSRANDQSGTYIICLFYPALLTLFLKGGEERNSVAVCRFYNPSIDLVLHFINGIFSSTNKATMITTCSGQHTFLKTKNSNYNKYPVKDLH